MKPVIFSAFKPFFRDQEQEQAKRHVNHFAKTQESGQHVHPYQLSSTHHFFLFISHSQYKGSQSNRQSQGQGICWHGICWLDIHRYQSQKYEEIFPNRRQTNGKEKEQSKHKHIGDPSRIGKNHRPVRKQICNADPYCLGKIRSRCIQGCISKSVKLCFFPVDTLICILSDIP